MFGVNCSSGYHKKQIPAIIAQTYFLRTHCAVTICVWKPGMLDEVVELGWASPRLHTWTHSGFLSTFNKSRGFGGGKLGCGELAFIYLPTWRIGDLSNTGQSKTIFQRRIRTLLGVWNIVASGEFAILEMNGLNSNVCSIQPLSA